MLFSSPPDGDDTRGMLLGCVYNSLVRSRVGAKLHGGHAGPLDFFQGRVRTQVALSISSISSVVMMSVSISDWDGSV